jgi:hypothetical protein
MTITKQNNRYTVIAKHKYGAVTQSNESMTKAIAGVYAIMERLQ